MLLTYCIYPSIYHLYRCTHISSVQFSRSVVSDSATPWTQHTRPPCRSPTPGVYSDSCPSSWLNTYIYIHLYTCTHICICIKYKTNVDAEFCLRERNVKHYFQCAGLTATRLCITHFLTCAQQGRKCRHTHTKCSQGEKTKQSVTVQKRDGPCGFETQFQGLSTCIQSNLQTTHPNGVWINGLGVI